MRLIVCVLIVMPLTGCLIGRAHVSERTSRSLTSDATGCPISEILIENLTITPEKLRKWGAFCRDKRFICSHAPATGVKCTEAM